MKRYEPKFAEWRELTPPVATWGASQTSNVRRGAYFWVARPVWKTQRRTDYLARSGPKRCGRPFTLRCGTVPVWAHTPDYRVQLPAPLPIPKTKEGRREAARVGETRTGQTAEGGRTELAARSGKATSRTSGAGEVESQRERADRKTVAHEPRTCQRGPIAPCLQSGKNRHSSRLNGWTVLEDWPSRMVPKEKLIAAEPTSLPTLSLDESKGPYVKADAHGGGLKNDRLGCTFHVELYNVSPRGDTCFTHLYQPLTKGSFVNC